jgi:hypothetical protein
MADQGGPNDYAAALQVATRGIDLESLTALNKSVSNYYLQLFNLPFTAGTRNITDSVVATGALTLAGHKFQNGDAVTIAGALSAMGSGYVRIAPPTVSEDLFYVYDTLAHALAGGATGLIAPAGGGLTGTVIITGVIPEEMPLLGTALTPSNIISYVNGRFNRGLYVRAVTAINGSTLAGADVKYTPRYRAIAGV